MTETPEPFRPPDWLLELAPEHAQRIMDGLKQVLMDGLTDQAIALRPSPAIRDRPKGVARPYLSAAIREAEVIDRNLRRQAATTRAVREHADRRRRIATGQTRVGDAHSWYANLRWSDQAWGTLYPIERRPERWVP